MKPQVGDIFVVTVYVHTDARDKGKAPKTIEVRAGQKEIKTSEFEKLPAKELSDNAYCGRCVMVCLIMVTHFIIQDNIYYWKYFLNSKLLMNFNVDQR